MIIFFDRHDGEIIGYVGGRKHYRGEEKFWIGDKSRTYRILYEPSAPYFEEAIKDPLMARKFKVNLLTLELEPKDFKDKL